MMKLRGPQPWSSRPTVLLPRAADYVGNVSSANQKLTGDSCCQLLTGWKPLIQVISNEWDRVSRKTNRTLSLEDQRWGQICVTAGWPPTNTLQPLLTCQQCPQTPARRPAPPAWRWADTAWPATLFHTPSPSLSLCFGKLLCGHTQSSHRTFSLFCCRQTHMRSLSDWCAGHSGTDWAPTVRLQLSSPPGAQSLIWRLAGCPPDCVLSGYSTEHLWCSRAHCTQSVVYPPGIQRLGSGSHRLRPERLLQSTDKPETWRKGKHQKYIFI